MGLQEDRKRLTVDIIRDKENNVPGKSNDNQPLKDLLERPVN